MRLEKYDIDNTNIFKKNDWIEEGVNTNTNTNERAFLCLKHFIENNALGIGLNILEVGPLPIDDYNKEFKAPIGLFKKELSKNNFLGVGLHKGDRGEEKVNKIMGEVPFIEGLINSQYPDEGINLVKKYFDGNIDIIYGSHVFESSSALNSTFPLGRDKMLDGSVQLLKDGGFIIMDNAYGGLLTALTGNEPYSKHLSLFAIYKYADNNSIIIFQKPHGTNKLAEVEATKVKNENILFNLRKRVGKVEKILNNGEIRFQKAFNDNKIKKIQIQIDKIKSTLLNIKNKEIKDKDELITKFNNKIKDFNSIIDKCTTNLNELHRKEINNLDKIEELETEKEELETEIKKYSNLINGIY